MRVFNIAVTNVELPSEITPEQAKQAIEDVLAVLKTGKVPPTPAPPTTIKVAGPPPVTKPITVHVTLRGRTIRKKGKFPCRRVPDPLWASAILWPSGVPKEGCGRTFTNAKQLVAHEAGWLDVAHTKRFNDSGMFPHGCLDAILPLEKRDTR